MKQTWILPEELGRYEREKVNPLESLPESFGSFLLLLEMFAPQNLLHLSFTPPSSEHLEAE